MVEIQNTGSDPLTVYDVWSASRDFLVPKMEGITVAPSSHKNATIYFTPSEEGCFSTPIFFSTNKGEIPYTVTHCSHYATKDFHINTLRYMTNTNCSFSVKIPPQLKMSLQKKLSIGVNFDGNLFSLDQIDYDINRVFLDIKYNIKPGYYLTFVHMETQFSMATVPLFISLSQRFLQPLQPVITVPLLTKPNETMYVDVVLVNPTAGNFALISSSLYKESSTIKFESLPPPLVFPRHCKTVIGRLKITGDTEGQFDTSLVVTYEGINPPVSQTIDIPIKASVLYGYLKPSEEEIFISKASQETHTFRFINMFKQPVFILEAYVNSTLFSVKPLLVNLVDPDDESPNVVINLPKITTDKKIHAKLIVQTNATTLTVPIIVFPGNVYIFESHHLGPTRTNTMNFYSGNVLCGTSTNYSLFVFNDNPDNFKIRKVECTPGISLNKNVMSLNKIKWQDFVCKKFSVAKFNFFVTFNQVSSSKPRQDTITFIGESSQFSVTFLWNPVSGNFELECQFDKNVIVGRHYEGTMYVSISYPKYVKIFGVDSFHPCVNVSSANPFIKPEVMMGNMQFLANFSFDADSNFVKNYNNFIHLLDQDSPFYEDLSKFDFDMMNFSFCKLYMFIYLKNNFFISIPTCFSMQKMRMHDRDYNFGIIPANVVSNYSRTINNILDLPIEFTFNEIPDLPDDVSITTDGTVVVPSMGSAQFNFHLMKKTKGFIDIYLPVSSNATESLSLHFIAEVVEPKFDLVNEKGNVISTLEFNRSDDRRYIGRMWFQYYYVRNFGKTEISLKLNKISNPNLKNHPYIVSDLNCELLRPGMQYPFIVGVNLMRIPKRKLDLNVNISVNNIDYTIPMKVVVSESSAALLSFLRKILIIIFATLGLYSPFMSFVEFFKVRRRFLKIVNSKKKSKDQEVYSLSLSVKINVETQFEFIKEEVDVGGRFVIVDPPVPESLIDKRSIATLEKLLTS
ncbi:hypothetical protein TVAG_401650 [Trichomonas vaginalis G3]|uniref:Uncharacterized protein n=1 Tax=Trichomonas vaginalis (strain ATCC PRA-98 / G3) TaxID=412133 RepID=A2EGD2_TRIV3|nr:RW1 protein-like protein family [Trichomonas vaginalis G3]EAY08311.1 hypothetical protein TVAG_401650 [Trichomonas vaginalis G3]KAI5546088.1 RW1 protein-like protein family [Trichomonas vaginalis G3]|eukprot:XP_001320534.1 hypothetical protein [Trichomonas vaginalis G3]